MIDRALDAVAPTPPTRTEPVPVWRDDPPLLTEPVVAGDTHGYLRPDGQPERCDRAELLRKLRKETWTEVVYVPGVSAPQESLELYAPGLRTPVRPENAGLMEDFRRELRRHAMRDAALRGAATLVAGVFAAARFPEDGIRSLPGFLTAVLGALFLLSLHRVHEARRSDDGIFARARQTYRHEAWTRAQPAPFSRALVAVLGILYVLTVNTELSIPGAGLVKPAVWDGEVWRMLTGPMLHANFYHAWFNLIALFALGRLVERHASRSHFAVVLLVSVLGGSMLSLLASGRPSVGTSGGSLGLVGFLWMIARMRPAELPDDFGRGMQYVMGAVALFGIVGMEFIDNWAHLGGLLAGGALGWLVLRGDSDLRDGGWPMRVAGIAATIVLVLAVVGAAVQGSWIRLFI